MREEPLPARGSAKSGAAWSGPSIGVGNGVASYLATKRQGIATLKILGAGSGDILRIYLVQILAVSALAILGGLIAGALIPPAIIAAAGDVLPVKPGFAIHPLPLAVSAA